MYPISVKLRRPGLTFIVSQMVLFLTFAYVWWYHYLSWRLDATTSLMGIVVRLHTMSHDLHDAQLVKNEKQKMIKQGNTQINYEKIFGKRQTIKDYRINHACHHEISLFIYLAYMLFFVHCLCGSNLTITDFMRISNQTNYAKNGWKSKDVDGDNKKQIFPEPSWKVLFIAILEVVLTAAIFVLGDALLPMQNAYNLSNAVPLVKRLCIISMYGYVSQFKYHVGWNMLDLATITSGAAFSGVDYDENEKIVEIYWKNAKNINSLKLLFPQRTADISRNWNMTINHWLTYYVFYRFNPPKWMEKVLGNWGAKILVTRVTAAIWHGIYAGYYIFFLLSYLMTIGIDLLREVLPTREKLENKSSFYAFTLCVFWAMLINFTCGLTVHWATNLNTKQVIDLMNEVNWIPIWILLAIIIIAKVLNISKKYYSVITHKEL